MAGNNYTAENTATYDTTAEKYGTAALTGPYTDTNTSSGTGGIYGPTGLNVVGWSMDFWYKRSTAPSATTTPIGVYLVYLSADASSFFPAVSTTGTMALNVFDTSGTAVTTASSSNICTGAWVHVAITVTPSLIYLFINGSLVSSTAPASGHTISCAPTNMAIGNAYGYPQFPDTGAEFDELAIWPTAKYTAAFTPNTAAYSGTEGMVTLLHFDSNLTDSAAALAIAPNNSAYLYNPVASPASNWLIGSTSAMTINPGYIRTAFTGTSCSAKFDTTNLMTPFPQIYITVDGVRTQYTVASSINLTIPTTDTWGYHTVEIETKALTENQNRWSPQNSYIAFLGLAPSGTGAGLVASSQPVNQWVAFYGDSITEGVRTLATTNTTSGGDDVDGIDSTLSWAYMQRQLLGVDVGLFAFGGSDVNVPTDSYGNVPATTSTYNYLWSGQTRAVSTMPSAVVINLGTNGAQASGLTQANYQAPFLTLLQGLLNLYLGVPIIVMDPFQGSGANMTPANRATVIAAQRAATTQANNSLITNVSTTGLFLGASSISVEGTHPYGNVNRTTIGPFVANMLRPYVYPTAGTRFHPGFH